MKTYLRFAQCCLIFLALLLTSASNAASGQPTTVATFSSQEQGLGPEYQISVPSDPETDRYQPSTAYNSTNHETLVVWHRHGGGFYYIEGRLIDARGKPRGSSPTILVSGSTPVYQPAVAYNAIDNQYLLVWMRNTLLDGKTYAIWGKVLSADLTEVRPEFEIFSPPANYSLWSPRVASNSIYNNMGELGVVPVYMVVWNAFDISAWPALIPDNISEKNLYENGNVVGPFLVIGNSASNLIYPQQVDLAFSPAGPYGEYLLVWKQVKPSTADYDIWAAYIDAYFGSIQEGVPPWKVDDSTSDQSSPRIAATGTDDFMVVWQERSPRPPNDWDIHGREMNQIGTFISDLHIIAGYGATDETNPFVASWVGDTPHYVVGYQRQSATGQGIWLTYYNNGANAIHLSPYIIWLEEFPAADYGFWSNNTPTGVIAGPNLQMAYQGVSNTPGDHPHIYSRTWTPFLAYLPLVSK